MHSPYTRRRVCGIVLLLLIFMLDQWSKNAVLAAARAGVIPFEILPVFNLVMVRNHGISFGIFAGGQAWVPLMLTLITSLVALALVIWLLVAKEWPVCLALGFITGGALGNIVDRVRLGAVTDFLDAHLGPHHWPAFNLADSAIFIGVVILVLISIVGRANEGDVTP